MKHRMLATGILVAALIGMIAFGINAQPPGTVQLKAPPTDVDTDVIRKSAQAFAAAFNKGDAVAIAGMWTANGESRDADGTSAVGRAAIEKDYADFFKKNPGAKLDVIVKSVRFPAASLAVEEGILRQWQGAKDLPTSTNYVAVHVNENGQWKIALSSEAGAGHDRLEDLDWLLGSWTTKIKDDDVKFTFTRDPAKPLIQATFTRSQPGKSAIAGSIRIALDPETGRIRSWGFEDDEAHSQSLWVCDGKSWILDTKGVLANGTSIAERIVLQRVAPEVITWRAIDRVMGDNALPDTTPMRLTRVK